MLGHSGHVNQYSPGVLCGNVAEERAAQARHSHRQHQMIILLP